MARSKSHPDPETIPDLLRAAIIRSGKTHYMLAQVADVDTRQIDRFVIGERDLTLETAGRIAVALGLTLRPRRGRTVRRPAIA